MAASAISVTARCIDRLDKSCAQGSRPIHVLPLQLSLVRQDYQSHRGTSMDSIAAHHIQNSGSVGRRGTDWDRG